ncbi:hypothetical_protein_-_conserved [Leishmania infantum]|uniref:Hypothetical_protein_-_conserved n=1 Tax=Leishmania infantum TaxID=5671 RepID=A0A381ME75_LEIIN|nr:hypothetical_protein_-_conserved [Leishmania infantum]CAC9471694.1 hypothetical_protein_-_conserved [Leishmania infantum]CAC9471729.1 hypothetical_protein_-_conserved [Leishmania infantum]CAC9471759.1 hypothetical_protein_-_conserved [Leishmania infantum]CAC9471792.1 hypothetical_protein_-_conserved [Leishmania infantum]
MARALGFVLRSTARQLADRLLQPPRLRPLRRRRVLGQLLQLRQQRLHVRVIGHVQLAQRHAARQRPDKRQPLTQRLLVACVLRHQLARARTHPLLHTRQRLPRRRRRRLERRVLGRQTHEHGVVLQAYRREQLARHGGAEERVACLQRRLRAHLRRTCARRVAVQLRHAVLHLLLHTPNAVCVDGLVLPHQRRAQRHQRLVVRVAHLRARQQRHRVRLLLPHLAGDIHRHLPRVQNAAAAVAVASAVVVAQLAALQRHVVHVQQAWRVGRAASASLPAPALHLSTALAHEILHVGQRFPVGCRV